MKTIIAGSRGITDIKIVERIVRESGFDISLVVSGGANGVDKLGERWAQLNKVPFTVYPAQWDLYGKSAGYKRNVLMAENADALIAIWDGRSKGTSHMINIANEFKLEVFVYSEIHGTVRYKDGTIQTA
jgi:hypothetical protein